MAHKDFETVAKQMYPDQPHMQDCIEPHWLAFEIKDITGVRPPDDSISIEYIDNGGEIPCNIKGVRNHHIEVYVDGKHTANYGALVIDGKYEGDTIINI